MYWYSADSSCFVLSRLVWLGLVLVTSLLVRTLSTISSSVSNKILTVESCRRLLRRSAYPRNANISTEGSFQKTSSRCSARRVNRYISWASQDPMTSFLRSAEVASFRSTPAIFSWRSNRALAALRVASTYFPRHSWEVKSSFGVGGSMTRENEEGEG